MIVHCPKCNQKYDIDDSMAGQNGKCSVCNSSFTMTRQVDNPTQITQAAIPPVVCPKCGARNGLRATFCKKCHSIINPVLLPNKKSSFRDPFTYIAFLFLAGVIAMICWGTISCQNSIKEDKAQEQKYGSLFQAKILVRDSIEKMLKAPSTANIVFTKKTDFKNGEYSFAGYVDAQNSFGAMIRNNFAADIAYEDGEYKCKRFDMR